MSQEPTVIQLNSENSIQFLVQYIELAQKAGAFELAESDVLKRSIDILVNKVVDNEISEDNAKVFVIRGILKGQKAGAFTLNDASLLHKVITFINTQPTASTVPNPTPNITPNITQTYKKAEEEPAPDFDLSELSDNVPLII